MPKESLYDFERRLYLAKHPEYGLNPNKPIKKAMPIRKKYAVKRKPLVKKRALKRVTRARAPRSKYSMSNLGPVGRLGQMAGTALGGYFGGPAGAAIGSKLGSYAHHIGKIFGSGDYVASEGISKNSLLSSNQAPQFVGKTSITVRHREYLGDVISSGTANTFQIQSYGINPGDQVTFPWLSQVVGATFQQYRINGMCFEFRSMSADALNSVNTALGTVIMCTDYDSADAPFTTKAQMENSEFGVSCKPSSNMIHAIECARSQTSVSELYIRAYDPPANTDIRLYDMGKFYIATQGCQGTSVNLGELWCTYDITMLKAIEQPPGYIVAASQYNLVGVTSTRPLGTIDTATNEGVVNELALTLSYDSGTGFNSIVFPVTILKNQIFAVAYKVLGTSTAGVATITMIGSNGLNAYGSNHFNSPPTGTATSTDRASFSFFQYNGSGTVALPPSIIVSGGVVPTAITFAGLVVTEVSSGITSA